MTTLRTPQDARWSCQRCGACCRSFALGPVEPEIIAALQSADIAAHWPPAAEAPWHRDGYLTHRDGACVFLMPDRRCFLHSHLGPESKPGFCRQFPLRFVRDPGGMVAVVRPDCTGFSRSHRSGAPMQQAVEDVAGMALAVTPFTPEQVTILPGRSVALDDWMELEAALLATLRELDAEPVALIAATRHALGLSGAAEPTRATLAMRAVMAALSAALSAAPDDAFTERMRRIAATPICAPAPLKAADRAYFNLLLRSHIQGKAFAPYGSLASGLGLFLLNARIARLANPSDPGPTLSAWVRFSLNRTLHPLLRRAAPALVDIFRCS